MWSIINIVILTFSFVAGSNAYFPRQLNTTAPTSSNFASNTFISAPTSSCPATSTIIHICDCYESYISITLIPSKAAALITSIPSTPNGTVQTTLTYSTTVTQCSSSSIASPIPLISVQSSLVVTSTSIFSTLVTGNTQLSSPIASSSTVQSTSINSSTATASSTESASTFTPTDTVQSASSVFLSSLQSPPAAATSARTSNPLSLTSLIEYTSSVAPNPVFTIETGYLPGTTITTSFTVPSVMPTSTLSNSSTSGASSSSSGSNSLVKAVVGIVVGAVLFAALCEVLSSGGRGYQASFEGWRAEQGELGGLIWICITRSETHFFTAGAKEYKH
ncbi:hypothetical protein N431DRAFT_441395 [Stipitochalara longipes BDJ]|nr:hypothetical protein N431DRAFT_441395 [Stipitochalara longipes BDJ]